MVRLANRWVILLGCVFFGVVCFDSSSRLQAQMKTWDGKFSIEKIEVTMVYFVPADRKPIKDWRERLQYYASRIEMFHQREFEGQSVVKVNIPENPFHSSQPTDRLRGGDANQIFFKTMQEVDSGLNFGRGVDDTFPILLVMSEINWKPLDDFYRLRPSQGKLDFEGNYNNGRHFPGAESGGARAVYWDNRGVGWGLVSADGWRVPYSGSDCVVYHEGVGHTVGMPHPEANASVMSLGQYQGWINESYVDLAQKRQLGWKPDAKAPDPSLFTQFTALPSPTVPRPNEKVRLKCAWPDKIKVDSITVEYQVALDSPWVYVDQASTINNDSGPPEYLTLGVFDRPTPVAYRIRAKAEDGEKVELYGYFQVRSSPEEFPLPNVDRFEDLTSIDLDNVGRRVQHVGGETLTFGPDVDVLRELPQEVTSVAGNWDRQGDSLLSPKQYGARIELPIKVPDEYQMVYLVEPLDEPNALTLGQLSKGNRFLILLDFNVDGKRQSALENVSGRNVGNETTIERAIFERNRISQVVCTILKDRVLVDVDAVRVIDWSGKPSDLSLSEYWETPNKNLLFVGAYDCRYRIHRIMLREVRR